MYLLMSTMIIDSNIGVLRCIEWVGIRLSIKRETEHHVVWHKRNDAIILIVNTTYVPSISFLLLPLP